MCLRRNTPMIHRLNSALNCSQQQIKPAVHHRILVSQAPRQWVIIPAPNYTMCPWEVLPCGATRGSRATSLYANHPSPPPPPRFERYWSRWCAGPYLVSLRPQSGPEFVLSLNSEGVGPRSCCVSHSMTPAAPEPPPPCPEFLTHSWGGGVRNATHSIAPPPPPCAAPAAPYE